MNIYILLGTPTIGELGMGTETNQKTVCENCNITETVYEDITYIFDKWNGEDIISGFAEYFISERLKEKLEYNNVKGYKLKKINVAFTTKKTGRKFGKDAYQKELPNFYHFITTGTARGMVDTWYKHISTCEICFKEKWRPIREGIRSSNNPELIGEDVKNPAPKLIYKSTWNKDDIFTLQDGYRVPILTQKFVDVLDTLNISINKKGGVWIRPTNWINDDGNIIE